MKTITKVMLTFLALFLFSCEKIENTSYSIALANLDSVDYHLQYFGNNKMIDTVLLSIMNNDGPKVLGLLDTTFYDQVLPEYTNEEFLEKVKTLKIFRLIDGDTVYYGGSVDYCLNKDNWGYSYGEDYVYGMHHYFLRLGRD